MMAVFEQEMLSNTLLYTTYIFRLRIDFKISFAEVRYFFFSFFFLVKLLKPSSLCHLSKFWMESGMYCVTGKNILRCAFLKYSENGGPLHHRL